MTARLIVGDTRAVTAGIPDGSVDLIMTSPPFLALRSYLPADHPDKALEIGSEATPAAFIDVLLQLTAEWRRILAPHGSIVVELGDKYAGDDRRHAEPVDAKTPHRHLVGRPQSSRANVGKGWPMNKSLVGIPERYRLSLIDGVNICNGKPSPAGRWQVRNVIRWVRPNPPVGALGKKWRPATSDLVVATPNDDARFWDGDATRVALQHPEQKATARKITDPQISGRGLKDYDPSMSAGAPLLDWWKIVPKGYEGSHYATFPPELCVAPIDAMCPRRVCVTCGRASERVTSEPTYEPSTNPNTSSNRKAGPAVVWDSGVDKGRGAHSDKSDGGMVRTTNTTGWTTCGCPDTDGLRLDGFHDGPGWRPGIVLDPFAGTGTVLAVASGMGRDSLGIDIDERNAVLAMERIGWIFLTVEHHDPDRPAFVSKVPHNSTGNPKFRVGYLNADGRKNPRMKPGYGETA